MSDFGVGLVVGQSLSKLSLAEMNGIALGWRDRAEMLTKQLENADSNVGALTYQLNAAITLIKEMRAEILESNPDSPYAQRDFTKARAAELAIMLAHDDGYEIDFEKDRVSPIR